MRSSTLRYCCAVLNTGSHGVAARRTARSGVRPFEVSVFVYAALVPFESLAVGSGSIVRVWGFVLVALGLARAASRFTISPRVFGLLLAPAVLSALSYWWSFDPAATMQRTATFFLLAAVAILVVGIGTPATVRASLYGLVVGSVIATYFVWRDYQALQFAIATEIRSTTAGANANDLAATLAVASGVSLGLALAARGRTAMLFAAAAAVTAAGAILTASRTAAASVLLAVALAAVLRGAGAGRRLVALAGIGVAAWWMLPRLDTRVTERVLGTYQSASQGDLNFRTALWAAGWRGFSERPLTGWGGGTYTAMTGELIGYAGAPHSTLLDMLANFGILGLVTWVALATMAVIAVRRVRGQLLAAFILGGTVLAVNMLLLSWDYRKLPWLFLAVALAAANRDDEEPHEIRNTLALGPLITRLVGTR